MSAATRWGRGERGRCWGSVGGGHGKGWHLETRAGRTRLRCALLLVRGCALASLTTLATFAAFLQTQKPSASAASCAVGTQLIEIRVQFFISGTEHGPPQGTAGGAPHPPR